MKETNVTKGKYQNMSDYLISGPLISVIIVVYNAEQHLEQTINSVLNQSYLNIELIIIDGGSTDGTLKIIDKYKANINYWKSEPDKGIYDAMNKGIDAASGDWIYFLGSGDVLYDVFHKVANNLKADNCIYYGNVFRKDSGKIYDGKFSAFKLAVSNICHQAIFYPKAALKKYKFDLKYKTLADHNLNMQCFGDSSFRFVYIDELISDYDGAGFSAHNNIDEAFFKDKPQIIKANFPLLVFYYTSLRRMVAKIIRN